MLPWFKFTEFNFFGLPIQVWGFFVALGMILSMIIIAKRADFYKENKEQMLDIAIWAVVGGVVGARLFHIFFYELTFFWQNPGELFKIWHGGLSSFGGLFGAIAAVLFYIKFKKINYNNSRLIKIADLLAFGAVYGWMLGRVGCFSIHDHLGMKCNCFLAINTPDGPRLEMALLEIIFLIPLAILFFISRKKKKPAGWFLSVLFVYYGVLRFVLDFFRARDIAEADARYLGLTPAQYFSILLVFLGINFFQKIKKGRFARLR